MFRCSPLCILSLPKASKDPMIIGAHEDTVPLLQRIFPDHNVKASTWSSKISDLTKGALDGGIQAYMTTEVPTIRHLIDKDPIITPLEGFNGTKLGYSQVIFTTEQVLADDRHAVVSAFLDAMFQGWKMAIRNPEEAVSMVEEVKKMLGLDDDHNDYWHPSGSYQTEMMQLCNDFVKETFEGDHYGVINPTRWNAATHWLLIDHGMEDNYGFDPLLWKPPSQLLAGNELARTLMRQENERVSRQFYNDNFTPSGRGRARAVVNAAGRTWDHQATVCHQALQAR